MCDDLNLIIAYICSSKELHRIAVRVEHGMNNELSDVFKYYAEPENHDKIKSLLPLYIRNHIDKIVEVTPLFAIAEITEEMLENGGEN
jgi:hypothetical protein